MSPMITGKPWTKAEDRRFAEVYSEKGIRAAMAALPHRSRHALLQRAVRLGVARRKWWTPQEDELLRRLWGYETVARIAQQLQRTPSRVAWRAANLRLPMGCPPGYEYVDAAARRTGYKSEQLRRILKWAGVRIWPSFSKPGREAGRHYRHVVDSYDVDEAVAAYHRTETLKAAAQRNGVSASTLLRWLEEAKIKLTRAPASRRAGRVRIEHPRLHFRIESSLVDKIVREKRESGARNETLTDAAKRLGVSRKRMGRWMRATGIEAPAHRIWRLPPEAFDEVARSHGVGPSTARAA